MDSTDLFSASALLTLVLSLALCGLVGALCGRTRGKEGTGLLAGIFLGPIGWLLVLLAYPYAPPTPEQPVKPFVPPRTFGGPTLKKYSAQLEKDAAWEKAVRGE